MKKHFKENEKNYVERHGWLKSCQQKNYSRAVGVGWFELVLRRDDDNALRIALDLEVSSKRKQG